MTAGAPATGPVPPSVWVRPVPFSVGHLKAREDFRGVAARDRDRVEDLSDLAADDDDRQPVIEALAANPEGRQVQQLREAKRRVARKLLRQTIHGDCFPQLLGGLAADTHDREVQGGEDVVQVAEATVLLRVDERRVRAMLVRGIGTGIDVRYERGVIAAEAYLLPTGRRERERRTSIPISLCLSWCASIVPFKERGARL